MTTSPEEVADTATDEGASDPLAGATELADALSGNLRRALLGIEATIRSVTVAALAGGHPLIEDVPGVGKTILARALAASLGADLSRIQGHPDLLLGNLLVADSRARLPIKFVEVNLVVPDHRVHLRRDIDQPETDRVRPCLR